MAPDIEVACKLLGIEGEFDLVQIERARRRALLSAHPDHGGSRENLEAIEAACVVLREYLRGAELRKPPSDCSSLGGDKPSFTLDVLPVEAYEALLVASSVLGDVVVDDPPYLLEVRMTEPCEVWLTFELVPDAGGSTISFTYESSAPLVSDQLRDLWIATLNETHPA